MIDENVFNIKGLLSNNFKINLDEENINNFYNSNVYSQILMGNKSSLTFEYLLNLGYMRLNDLKTISKYNESNITVKINSKKEYDDIIDDDTIFLDKNFINANLNLFECMEQRSSERFYSEKLMNFEEFSTICHYSFGLSNRKMNYNGIIAPARFYASGGGIYPLDIFFYINNVKNIKKGIYKYQVFTHSLKFIDNEFNVKQFLENGNFDFDNYSFLVLYKYDINKNYLKYGELSLLLTLIETGNISHQFELVTTALNFKSCQVAGFDKNYAQKVLDLDGVNSHILFTNICGRKK